jgi:hypothetical protein
MPVLAKPNFATGIKETVHQLKVERDTWQAVALQYRAAFEAQTSRLKELQDICFATQAELENERAEQHRSHGLPDRCHRDRHSTIDSAEERSPRSFGTATVFPLDNLSRQRRTSDQCNNPLFHHVQHCIDQCNFGTAIVEIERLLRGPLSPKARAEGLLLKSAILRASGPDELYDALAACSEALELCDRLSDLKSLLPRIQYQRGILYYQLRMLHQARDAIGAVEEDKMLHKPAHEYHRSCDDGIHLQRTANRRSGFDEHRSFDEDLLVKLDEKLDVGRTRYHHGLEGYLQGIGEEPPYKCTAASSNCRKVETHVASSMLGEW